MFAVKMPASTKREIVSKSITKYPVTKCFVQRFLGDYDTKIVTQLFKIYVFVDFLSC